MFVWRLFLTLCIQRGRDADCGGRVGAHEGVAHCRRLDERELAVACVDIRGRAVIRH